MEQIGLLSAFPTTKMGSANEDEDQLIAEVFVGSLSLRSLGQTNIDGLQDPHRLDFVG